MSVRSGLSSKPLGQKQAYETKRYYTRKARQGVIAVLQDITPQETGPLYRAVCSSDVVRRQISGNEDSDDDTVDVTLMEALA